MTLNRIIPSVKNIFLLFTIISCCTIAKSDETIHTQLIKEKISFSQYVTNIKKEAVAKGIHKKTVKDAFKKVKQLQHSVKSDKKQPEFKLKLDKYVLRTVPRWKIKKARKLYKKYYKLLYKIGKEYHVQPRFIVSLWGIETNFGSLTGKVSIISTLTTMAYEGRREKLFKRQLFAALTILEKGNITSDKFIGSWAGAMGQIQFMPTSYLNYAVDYTGNGKKDIWKSKADIFASAANYLKKEGWKGNQTWGRQVILPKDFDLTLAGLNHKKTLAQWQALGVRRFNGSNLPKVNINASIIMPDDINSRIYLVYNNFHVLMHWNRSYYFSIAVCYLSDKIKYPHIKGL